MSSYRNFIQDFPMRCLDILENFERHQIFRGREVTLSITIATSALIIPFERLRPDKVDHIANDRYSECIVEFQNFLKTPFRKWNNGESWKFYKRIPGKELRNGYEWITDLPLSEIQPTQTNNEIFSILRNALAHGNIIENPSRQRSMIESLFFLSKRFDDVDKKPLDEYKLLRVSPHDFTVLIKQWIKFLSELHIPEYPYQLVDYAIANYEEISY